MNAKITAAVMIVGALVAAAAWWLTADDIEEEQLSPSLRENESHETGPRRAPGLEADGRPVDPAAPAATPAAEIDTRVVARGSVETAEGRGVPTVVEISIRGRGGRGDGSMLVPTDAEGRFERDLTPLIGAGMELTAIVFSLSDIALRGDAVTVETSGAVEEDGGVVFETRLVARVQTLITGRVVDAEGIPLPEEAVIIVPAKNGRPAQEESIAKGRTDEDGRFALAVHTREPCIVLAAPRGRRPGAATVTPRPRSATDVGDVVSPESVAISGRLTAAGRGVPGAVVTAVAARRGWGVSRHDGSALGSVEIFRWLDGEVSRWKATARTDEDGGFELHGLAPERYRIYPEDHHGPYRLNPEGTGSWWYYAHLDGVELRPGMRVHLTGGVVESASLEVAAPAEGVDLRLDGALVDVVVSDGDAPVAEAEIDAGDGRTHSPETGADGRALLLLPPGKNTLTVSKDGYEAVERELALSAGEDPLEVAIELDAGRRASVVVIAMEPSGAPLTEAEIHLDPVHWDGRRSIRRGLAAADGRYDLGQVAPGEYRLVVMPSNQRPMTHEPRRIRVPESGLEEVTVEMALGARLRVGARRDGAFVSAPFSIRPVGGEPMQVTVHSTSPDGGSRMTTSSRPELGKALNRIETALLPGRYQLDFGEKEALVTRVVDLTAGDEREVIVDL